MTPYLVLIVRIVCISMGVFLIASRLFMYEKTQGFVQSKIEALWIQIDDYEKAALSKHLGFVKVVAAVMRSFFDRFFGVRLLSLQSLTVSVCYAVMMCCLMLILLERRTLGYWDKDFVMIFFVYLGFGSFPFLLTTFTGRAKRKKYLLIWLTVSLTLAHAMIVMPAFELWKAIHYSPVQWAETFILGIYLCIVIALALFCAFVGVMRKSLRLIEKSTSTLRTGAILLLNALPIVSAYALVRLLVLKLDYSQLNPALDYKDPAVIQSAFASWSTRIDVFLVFLLFAFCLFDIVFIFTALIFALLSALMFLHRLFWPVLSRVIYACQRFRIISDGKILIYAGVLLILIGIGRLSWWQALP